MKESIPKEMCVMPKGSPGMEPGCSFPCLPMSQPLQHAWAQSSDCINTPWGGLAAAPPHHTTNAAAECFRVLGSANNKGCFLSLCLA